MIDGITRMTGFGDERDAQTTCDVMGCEQL